MGSRLNPSSPNQRMWRSAASAHSYRNAQGLFAAESKIFSELDFVLASARLLDIGVGTGRTTQVLYQRVKDYVGCDYSPAMIDAARRRCPGATLQLADARDLSPFTSGSYDIVLFSFNGIDSLGHDDRLRALAEVRRVLKPGGVFIFSSHNRAAPRLPAWAATNLDIGWHPYRLARGAFMYTLGLFNSLRLAHHERVYADYAIVNDNAHQYGLLQYYVFASDQISQLSQAGFTDVVLYGHDGRRIEVSQACTDYMIHYVAKRG